MQQIKRILEMVAGERLSSGDAAKLLEALSPRLALRKGTWDHLFALLSTGDFSPDEVAGILEARRRGATISGFTGPMGLGDLADLNNLSGELAGSLNDLPEKLSGLVRRVRRAVRASHDHSLPASMLKIEAELADGSEVRANLPLALADHAPKLIPQAALEVLKAQGIDPDALRGMLSTSMPSGDLIDVKGADGTRLHVWVE